VTSDRQGHVIGIHQSVAPTDPDRPGPGFGRRRARDEKRSGRPFNLPADASSELAGAAGYAGTLLTGCLLPERGNVWDGTIDVVAAKSAASADT
jgi:hypothetical protein